MFAALSTLTLISSIAASTLAQDVNKLELRGLRARIPVQTLADSAVVRSLQQRQAAANEVEGKLEGSVQTAVSRMNAAAKIKHDIAVKQAHLRNARARQNILEARDGQIDQARDRLVSSLHADMDPKISMAQANLKKKQFELQEEAEAVKYWRDQQEKVRMDADEMMQDLKATRRQLEELHKQVDWATRQEELDSKTYEYNRQMAGQEVQSLKYAADQYKAESGRLKAAEDHFKQVELKFGSENNLWAMEKVEDARRDFRAQEDEAQNWKDNEDHIKAQVVAMIKDNTTSHDALLEAQAKKQWSKDQESQIEEQYKLKRGMAAQEVQTLKNVESKYKAEIDRFRAAGAAAKAAEESVQHWNAVRDVEQQKLQLSHSDGRGRVDSKIKDWEMARENTAREVADLEHQYATWENTQQHTVQEMANLKGSARERSQMYESRLHDATDMAQQDLFQDEMVSSPLAWDGAWAREEQPAAPSD